jgi:hypothetical protein
MGSRSLNTLSRLAVLLGRGFLEAPGGKTARRVGRSPRVIWVSFMCNLYSLTKGQAAIRDWFRAKHDRTGNLPLFRHDALGHALGTQAGRRCRLPGPRARQVLAGARNKNAAARVNNAVGGVKEPL